MDELLYRIALSMLPIKPQEQRMLLEAAGSATEVFHLSKRIEELIPDSNDKARAVMASMEGQLTGAAREIAFAERKNIRILTIDDDAYPYRLKQAEDAPTVLYYSGNADLNAKHIVSIVGTRSCTDYGKDLCRQFIADLKEAVPDLVVLSGLAYGIDVTAHLACLENGIPTVGVLAHGLDIIYPQVHRTYANDMVRNGGLLSEYRSGTDMNKSLFVARNRIVAACADATVVVESKEKGGSLHTARMALDYNRDVYAFPGRVTDKVSRGCLDLIFDNVARCVCDAKQFLECQGWDSLKTPDEHVVQTELFTELDETQLYIVGKMRSLDECNIAQLAAVTAIPVKQLNVHLAQMELAGVIEFSPGGKYRLAMSYRR